MQICGILQLQLYKVDTLMLIELDTLASLPASDDSSFLPKLNVVVPLDHFADAQNGKFGFHILECHWEWSLLGMCMNDASAFVDGLVAACGGGRVTSS